MELELTFLGTSSGAPTRDRNVTGLALRRGAAWDLFDCGEGTQHQVLQTTLSLPRLRRIFISHLHGDHCYGLFGLLGSRAMAGAQGPVALYGPAGLESMVRHVLELSSSYVDFPLEFHELDADGGRVVEDFRGTIDAVPLTHRVTSFAWWIRDAPRPGAFDARRAAELGVPAGPLYGQLQQGQAVTLDDGRVIGPEDVVGPPRPGRRLIVSGDNRDPAALLARTGPVDLLVHEATYTEDVVARMDGDDRGHSTAARVAAAANQAGVEQLVLTHFSARYGREEGASFATIHDVRAEARSHFAGPLHLASDFDRLVVDVSGSLRPPEPSGA